ncbi:hypothetical protein RFI_04081, partial [Reticulomyxa filosa]
TKQQLNILQIRVKELREKHNSLINNVPKTAREFYSSLEEPSIQILSPQKNIKKQFKPRVGIKNSQIPIQHRKYSSFQKATVLRNDNLAIEATTGEGKEWDDLGLQALDAYEKKKQQNHNKNNTQQLWEW